MVPRRPGHYCILYTGPVSPPLWPCHRWQWPRRGHWGTLITRWGQSRPLFSHFYMLLPSASIQCDHFYPDMHFNNLLTIFSSSPGVTRDGRARSVRSARSTRGACTGPAPRPGPASARRAGAARCATRTSTSAPTTGPATTAPPASTRGATTPAAAPSASRGATVRSAWSTSATSSPAGTAASAR